MRHRTKNDKIKTLWEYPPPRTNVLAYAKWFYRDVERRSRELAEQATKTKQENITTVILNGHTLASGTTNPKPYLRHADLCKRMQWCLDKHGLKCLETGVWVDDEGNTFRKD